MFLQCVSTVIIVYIIISPLNSYLYIYWTLNKYYYPQHQYCPEGKGSWCKYQVEWRPARVLDKNRQYKHKVSIKPEYGEQLVSLYNQLSSPGKLKFEILCVILASTNACQKWNA